jgi:methyl-accepting chemotaxis protein-1 (serine sensor receptor)
MTVKARLAGVIGLLSLLLAGVGVIGLVGMGKTKDGLKTVYEDRTVALKYLAQIDRLLNSNRLLTASSILDGHAEMAKENAGKIEKNIEMADKLWKDYMATEATEEEVKISKKFEKARAKLDKEALKPTIDALKAGDLEAAKKIYMGPGRELNVPVRENIEALVKIQIDVAKEEYENAVARYTTSRTVTISAIALGVLMGAALGMLLISGLYRQLGGEPVAAAEVARAIGDNDLTMTVVTKAGDTTSLMASMKKMQEQLTGTVSGIKQSADTISSASQQIATGNADLSQRTEEQASSLEETASSMEELTSTVKQNAENAKQANQLAASASEVAVKGGSVVGQVVTTMSSINESSKKIADIISVIDGIAFQTNILALNAAVEAARAGEQGRGFAVVATEVRTLAQRSAAAAKEIKELISDSVEKVGNGTKLVDEAGKTMEEIVTSVKRVTDIMAEITAASQEQSGGIEQVNTAITQMDQVTQQNAALVEEAAAAAESMQEQAQALVQVVAVYKLAEYSKAVAAPVVKAEKPAATVTQLPAREKVAAAKKPAPAKTRKVVGSDTQAQEWEEF